MMVSDKIGTLVCRVLLLLRDSMMPLAVLLARCGLDRPHNFLRGDVEAELRLFENPMSISRALREDRQQFEIYGEISQTGLIPAAFLLHGPDTAVLAGFWGLMREAFDAEGRVPRDLLEVLAAEVSELVRCPLCVSVHAAFMDGMGMTAAARYYALPAAERHPEQLAESHRRIVEWLAAHTTATGTDAAELDQAFDPAAKAELLGTAFAFHYIGGIYPLIVNGLCFIGLFMECVGLGQYRSTPWIRRGIYRMAVTWIGHSMRRQRPQGRSVTLRILEDSVLDPGTVEDTLWARPNRHIARTVNGFLAATERLAEKHLGSAIMAVVRARVDSWDGIEDPSEGDPDWARELAADSGLRPGLEQEAAKIGLQVALSPWQLQTERGAALLESFVREHRSAGDVDPSLLALLSWCRIRATSKFVARLAGSV